MIKKKHPSDCRCEHCCKCGGPNRLHINKPTPGKYIDAIQAHVSISNRHFVINDIKNSGYNISFTKLT